MANLPSGDGTGPAPGLGALLPRAADWQAADGWLPAGLLLAVTGTAGMVLLAWRHLDPSAVPPAARLLPAEGALTLLGLAAGVALSLRPTGQAAVWRWLSLALVAAGALLCDPAGLHVRFGFPWFVTAGLLGLGDRAGETLGSVLALPLHARARRRPRAVPEGASGVAPLLERGAEHPERAFDPTLGRSGLWTAWRLVAEFWALAALSGALAVLPAGTTWRLAAGAGAMGGAVLVIGAALATLQASWTARRLRFDPARAAAFWGLALAVAATLTMLMLVLPMPPAPLSAHALSGLLGALGHARLPFSGVGTATATASGGRMPSLAGMLILPLALLAALVREMWVYFGFWLLSPLALPVVLVVGAAAGVFLLRALRRPGFRALVGRALLALLEAVAFWRRVRLPRRLRGVLARLGLLSPQAKAPVSPGGPNVLERLWGFMDPRASVRLTYRRFLRAMAAAGAVRPAGQSPRAFEASVRDRELAGPDLAQLTAAYELARYSGHPPERGWLERARRGLAAATGRLAGRGHRRPRRG